MIEPYRADRDIYAALTKAGLSPFVGRVHSRPADGGEVRTAVYLSELGRREAVIDALVRAFGDITAIHRFDDRSMHMAPYVVAVHRWDG